MEEGRERLEDPVATSSQAEEAPKHGSMQPSLLQSHPLNDFEVPRSQTTEEPPSSTDTASRPAMPQGEHHQHASDTEVMETDSPSEGEAPSLAADSTADIPPVQAAVRPVSTRASSASELGDVPSAVANLSSNDLQAHADESHDSFAAPTEEVSAYLQQSGSPPKRQNSWALKESLGGTSNKVATYTWGRGDMGQLASGAAVNSLLPHAPEALRGRDVVHATGNLYNMACLTVDGDLLTVGNNDNGQLGIKGSDSLLAPVRVAALDAFSVHHAAVGLSHLVTVVADGMLASWGGNEFGQLGQGTEGADVANPRLVKRIRGQANVRVAAGESHSLTLTSSGQVSSFGHNAFGQLGQGDTANRDRPTEIEALWPLGVLQIACGDNHSAALTADGRVFTWGRGKYGQLGLGSFENSNYPQQVALPSKIYQIACGGDHSLAVGKDGELFSWGRSSWGQTGHGHEENLCRPRRVEALQNVDIIQVSAGSRHSLALSRVGDVYAFGNGELGQLGLGEQLNKSSPTQLPRFAEGLPLFVVAAGDNSIAVCHRSSSADTFALAGPQDRHGTGVTALTLPSLAALAEAASKDDPHALVTLKHAIEDMFSNPGFLIAQVAAANPASDTPPAAHGLDMAAVTRMYTAILRVYEADIVGALAGAAGRLADRIQSSNAASATGRASFADESMWMRALFILLQNPINSESMGKQIMQKLSRATAATKGKQQLMAWLGSLPPEVFGARNVRPLQKYLSSVAVRQGTVPAREELLLGLHMLLLMHNANEKAGRRIQPSEFYNTELSEALNLQQEYLSWLQLQDQRTKKQGRGSGTELVSVCQTAFCLNPQAKSKILQIEAFMQKRAHFQSGSVQALMQGVSPEHLQFLDIRVRREHLLEDALMQIIMRPRSDLKKPLRVTFISSGVPEEGLDQGGVTKEFFQLLIRAIFNEAYGMFVFDQQTRTFWFNHKAMEAEVQGEFRLVGSLIGLAVYSSVILDIHFPLVVYKKLLQQPLGFEDLKQAFPELGKGLQALLDFDGDVEATFLRSFEVEYDYFGETRRHPLKSGGSDIPVTKDNRREYVELYTRWLLHDSIASQFAAFAHGFHEVCGGPALTLFKSEELELLVCGLPHLDFEDLQAVARYDGGYNQEHPTIKAFWATLHAFSLQEKKLFLKFTTGCDRAPVGGLGNLELVVQRSGPDTEALPTTHTCFNYLLLPEYSSTDKLRRKLLTAINNAEGFGLQ